MALPALGSIQRFTYALCDNDRLRIAVSHCCIPGPSLQISNTKPDDTRELLHLAVLKDIGGRYL